MVRFINKAINPETFFHMLLLPFPQLSGFNYSFNTPHTPFLSKTGSPAPSHNQPQPRWPIFEIEEVICHEIPDDPLLEFVLALLEGIEQEYDFRLMASVAML